MNNLSLKNDLKDLIDNKDNIGKIFRSDIGGCSIEIHFKEELKQDSYIYVDYKSRNEDFEKLNEELK